MPDRPKPRRKKNKGKGKNSNGRQIKSNRSSGQKIASQASTSGRIIYTSNQTTSSHTSDASSQEMVMDDDLQVMVKRPSLNRSISESYGENHVPKEILFSGYHKVGERIQIRPLLSDQQNIPGRGATRGERHHLPHQDLEGQGHERGPREQQVYTQ